MKLRRSTLQMCRHAAANGSPPQPLIPSLSSRCCRRFALLKKISVTVSPGMKRPLRSGHSSGLSNFKGWWQIDNRSSKPLWKRLEKFVVVGCESSGRYVRFNSHTLSSATLQHLILFLRKRKSISNISNTFFFLRKAVHNYF